MNNTTQPLSCLLSPFSPPRFIFLFLRRSSDTSNSKTADDLSLRRCCLHCHKPRRHAFKTLDCSERLCRLLMWNETSQQYDPLEKIVFHQLDNDLVSNCLHSIFQFGFRQTHSTETALFKCLNDLFHETRLLSLFFFKPLLTIDTKEIWVYSTILELGGI